MKSLIVGVAVIVLALAGGLYVLAIQSHSGKAPGLADGNLQRCGSKPNCVSSMTPSSDEHHVSPITFTPGDADAVWSDLTDTIVDQGGRITHNGPPYLAAEFSSEVFGFVDDVECLINDESGSVQIRSASRVGYSDLNVNRERVEAIRAAMTRAP